MSRRAAAAAAVVVATTLGWIPAAPAHATAPAGASSLASSDGVALMGPLRREVARLLLDVARPAGDALVEQTVQAGDPAELDRALTVAGRLTGALEALAVDGDLASAAADLRRDAVLRRNLRAAGWFAEDVADDPRFADVYTDDGEPRAFEDVVTDSVLLQTLSELAHAAQDAWRARTGDTLSLDDTYGAGYDDALAETLR